MRLVLFLFAAMLAFPAVAAERLFAVPRTDGSVSILVIGSNGETNLNTDDLTPESQIARWPEDMQATVIFEDIKQVTRDELPADRTFRDAWTFKKASKKVDIDLPKAKEITKKKLADQYIDEDKALDRQAAEAAALGEDDEAASIRAKKAAIPRVTAKDIDAATSIAKLKGMLQRKK